MRPRVIPAEIIRQRRPAAPPQIGFNEAAGYPRGNLAFLPALPALRQIASMRPRVIPAEIVWVGYSQAPSSPELQ